MGDVVSDAETMAEGRYVRLVRRGQWEYAERIRGRNPVGIVAVTEAGRLLLVEQFRMPLQRRVIELPAGLVGDVAGQEAESLETAALRELEEETGYTAASIEVLTVGPPSSGLANELITLVRARGLKEDGRGGGDGTEDITVHEVALAALPAWLAARAREGLLVDPKVWAGMWWAANS